MASLKVAIVAECASTAIIIVASMQLPANIPLIAQYCQLDDLSCLPYKIPVSNG